MPSTGTVESEDPSASSSLSEVVVNFPSAVVGDTRPTVAGAPPRVESFSDPVHTVTFDNDEGTAGTVAVTRFRYPAPPSTTAPRRSLDLHLTDPGFAGRVIPAGDAATPTIGVLSG